MSYFKFLVSSIFLFASLIIWLPKKTRDLPEEPQKGQVILLNEASLTIKAGEQGTAFPSFKILQGFHIMADEMENENFLTTGLTVSGNHEIQFGTAQFPAPKEYSLTGSNESIQVFDGQLSIKIPVSVKSDASKGAYPVNAILFYQACDDTKCYFPRELPFQIMVNVK